MGAAVGRIGDVVKLLLLVLCALSCACQMSRTVYVDDSEIDVFVESVAEAVERWNERAGEELLELRVARLSRLGYLDPTSIYVTTQHRVIGPAGRKGNTTFSGLNMRVAIESDVEVDQPEKLPWLLTHELGHAMGLGHVEDDDCNVMREGWSECKMEPRVVATARQVRIARSVQLRWF